VTSAFVHIKTAYLIARRTTQIKETKQEKKEFK